MRGGSLSHWEPSDNVMKSEPGDTVKETDEILIALSHHQRRETLKILRTIGRPLALADLAIELTRQLENIDSTVEEQQRAERLKLELYHCHIPRLSDVGLVEYNEARNVVALTETATDSDVVTAEQELTAFGQ